MKRFERSVLALLLALGAAFTAWAQDAQPAEPITPAPEMAEPAPEIPDVAWVRLAHFSPNAPQVTIQFAPTDEEAAGTFTSDQFPAIGYQSFTEYVEIPSGNYTVTAQGVEGSVEEELSFARGNYYTLAAMGLVLPAEAQAEEQEGEGDDGGGFVGFFQNLFGNGDGDRDRLALQLMLIEDELTRVPNEGETLIRLVHAAPGTEPVDLAVVGEQGTIVNDVQFGDSSRYASYEGPIEDLEVRLSGSRAATLTLSEIDLQSGNLNTIYVVGTPVEQAPLTLMGSSIAPVEAGTPAGEDVAAQTQQAGEAAGGGVGEEAGEEEEGAEPGNQDDAEAESAAGDAADGEPADGEAADGEAAEGEAAEGGADAAEDAEDGDAAEATDDAGAEGEGEGTEEPATEGQ